MRPGSLRIWWTENFPKVLLNMATRDSETKIRAGGKQKVLKNLSPEVLNLSYQKRIGMKIFGSQ